MSEKKIVVYEEDIEKKKLTGRSVGWLMTPEITGGKHSSVCTVEVEPGMRALPAHAHENGEETVYITKGEGEVLIGEEIYKIKEGTIMFFPQGIPHMLYNTGTEMLKGICFYAPIPEAITYKYFEDVDFPYFK